VVVGSEDEAGKIEARWQKHLHSQLGNLDILLETMENISRILIVGMTVGRMDSHARESRNLD
jgi:hypothetical protein